MKKITLILKYFIYYIIGLISFSTIAFISQRITISILLQNAIYPSQDLYNLSNYILAFGIYYLIVYSVLYCIIVYCVRRYDKHLIAKLNKELENLKASNKKNNIRGNENG